MDKLLQAINPDRATDLLAWPKDKQITFSRLFEIVKGRLGL